MIGKPTQEDILKLSINNPALYAALQYWRQGACTFDESMMMAVVVLVEQNQIILDQNVELAKWSIKPPEISRRQ